MLSIRALTRSIPRSFPRLSSPSLYRPVSTLRQPSLLQRPWTTTPASRLTAAFSTSRTRWEKQGEVDEELVAKFESELQMENEMRDSDEVPVSVKDYLETGPFEMQDTPGQEDVVLTRQFGDETIRVVFSIADLNHLDPDADRYEDRALADEDDEDDEDRGPIPDASAQSGGAQSKAAVNAGRTSGDNIAVTTEDSVAPADRPELSDDGPAARDEDMEDDDGEEQDPSFPARLTVTVTKPGQGALQIETVAQDGMIVIDNVHYFADPALATDESLSARKAAYAGPPFGNLDEDLQVLLERYLDERGVNTALALFVPDYIDFKEQREYLSWLSNVKSFVEA